MEINLARHIIRTSFRSARELEELLQFLKSQLKEEEYKKYAMGIAAAIDAINVALINPTVAVRPELTDEIEASIEKYDRFL